MPPIVLLIPIISHFFNLKLCLSRDQGNDDSQWPEPKAMPKNPMLKAESAHQNACKQQKKKADGTKDFQKKFENYVYR